MNRESVLSVAVVLLMVLAVGCSSGVGADSEILAGTRVAILIGEGMYSTGAVDTSSYLRTRGASISTVGLTADPITPYDTPGRPLDVDVLVSEVGPDDFDVLIIPGGFATPVFGDRMANEREVIRFVREMMGAGRVVAAVCTGVEVVFRADVVSGLRVTGPELYRVSAVSQGATWVGEDLVRDGIMVTSRPTDCLRDFSRQVVEAILEAK